MSTYHTLGAVRFACPLCGHGIEVPVALDRLTPFGSALSPQYRVEFASASAGHQCPPATDGLRPIERFVTRGTLDDEGTGRTP